MPLSRVLSQEIQIAIDSTSNIKTIDRELENKLLLFPDYQDFQEARLFKKADNSFSLEISFLKNGDMVREKKELSATELEDFRSKIRAQIAKKAPSIGLDQSGRASFLTGTTLLSLSYYGWSVPYMLGSEGGAFTGLYFITSGAGFFLPYIWTKDSKVTKGMANLSIGAATLGLGHGAILWDLFGLSGYKNHTDQYGYTTSDYDAKSLNLFMTVTSISELLAGYFYADNNNVSEGRANAIVSSSAICGLYGGAMGYMIAGDDPDTWNITLPTLLGSLGGAVYGNYLANQQNFAPGDASVMSNAGLLGGLIGGVPLVFLEPDNGRVVVGTLMASSALGFYFGNEMIKGHDFSSNNATYISLGTIGGGLIGLGLAAIVLNKSDSETTAKIGYTMVTACATLGYAITYGSLRDGAKVGKGTSQLNMNFNPFGLFAGNFNKKTGYSVPFMNLNYNF